MAPALPAPPREPCDQDETQQTDNPTHRRQALASVNNLSSLMDEDDVGLQSQPSLAKDSQEMEQILVDLGNSDLAQSDLLQAFKALDGAGDILSTGDPDAIFPLSGLDLDTEVVDSEGDATEDKIKLVQARLERRCSFLQRRLRILQARSIGKRISEEVTQVYEKCSRAARKDGAGRTMGLKALLKKVETTSALQASAASRTVMKPEHYNPGTSRGDASRSASIGIPSGTLTGLQDTAGALRSHLSVVKHELDSDATLSSSGAESNDEAIMYNNPHQQHMPIEKRALWTWQRARASIASRWTWLQAQVQELEYKIRQHNDLHKQVREAKGPVEFEGEPEAYSGILPGAEPAEDLPASCARVRPLRRETFKKRKLLQMHNLHIATSKAAKPSDIRCTCRYPSVSCPLCTGRAEPTEPAPPAATLPPAARLARVLPSYHPVLSTTQDIPLVAHVSALASRPWFRSRCSKTWRAPRANTTTLTPVTVPAPRPKRLITTRSKRGRPPLSRKIRERERERDRDDEAATSGHESSRRGRPSTESRYRRQSYDIDNIVIPPSVAANTRPQILTYKEIITPKWRVMDQPSPLNNGVGHSSGSKPRRYSSDEDVSDTAVAARHARAEGRERARYVRQRRPRRSAGGDAAQPPEPSVPAPQPPILPPPPPPPVLHYESVRPYSPRDFPLPEPQYQAMMSAMPPGHRPPSPFDDDKPPDDDDIDNIDSIDNIDNSSTLSPLSPTPFDGDDPDDVEWDPSKEKSDRRKSSFR